MTTPASRWLPLRFALRELRGGLHGFYVFILCIALGSMAIAGVGSVAASLADGLAREGRVILGGDLAFTLIQREIASNERAFLQAHGQVSSAATMRAMARAPNGQATLVEMKAVDAAYPFSVKSNWIHHWRSSTHWRYATVFSARSPIRR